MSWLLSSIRILWDIWYLFNYYYPWLFVIHLASRHLGIYHGTTKLQQTDHPTCFRIDPPCGGNYQAVNANPWTTISSQQNKIYPPDYHLCNLALVGTLAQQLASPEWWARENATRGKGGPRTKRASNRKKKIERKKKIGTYLQNSPPSPTSHPFSPPPSLCFFPFLFLFLYQIFTVGYPLWIVWDLTVLTCLWAVISCQRRQRKGWVWPRSTNCVVATQGVVLVRKEKKISIGHHGPAKIPSAAADCPEP